MNTFKQSFFLASAWFWCIGGFFPVLLMTEFGKMGFFPFFFVNVLGAGAFGFVLNAQRREKFLQRFNFHAQLFSVVVVCYHAIFISWISLMLQSVIPIAVFISLTALLAWGKMQLSLISVGLFFVTLGLFCFAIIPSEAYHGAVQTNIDGLGHYVVPLALGFILAPYFDLTFHRAYADSTNPRLTFFIGFGLLFPMLLACMFFAAPILGSLWLPEFTVSKNSLICMVTLLVLQTSFTTATHWRELKGTIWLNILTVKKLLSVVCLCIGIHVVVAIGKTEQLFNIGDMFYRTFLFIIGAIFPVILLFERMNKHAKMAMALLSVCYTLGFILGGSLTFFVTIGMIGLGVIYFSYYQQKKTINEGVTDFST